MIDSVTIHYPNGTPNVRSQKPFKRDVLATKKTLYGGRGMTLEEELNESNRYYLSHEMAVIHKKPTPIQIVKVDYPKRSAAVIKEAYFRQASTTDYNGVYKQRYIDFDAKETHNKTSFPLTNFHAHQIEHMRRCLKQGGICFALIKFVQTDELFVLPASTLISYWDQQNTGRKSIAKNDFDKHAIPVSYALNPVIPYLKAVDDLLS